MFIPDLSGCPDQRLPPIITLARFASFLLGRGAGCSAAGKRAVDGVKYAPITRPGPARDNRQMDGGCLRSAVINRTPAGWDQGMAAPQFSLQCSVSRCSRLLDRVRKEETDTLAVTPLSETVTQSGRLAGFLVSARRAARGYCYCLGRRRDAQSAAAQPDPPAPRARQECLFSFTQMKENSGFAINSRGSYEKRQFRFLASVIWRRSGLRPGPA